jgi:hypothetical protein
MQTPNQEYPAVCRMTLIAASEESGLRALTELRTP